ncbi:hypothetical protein RND71_023438 [Anisodus tanguticus]|uniref:Uncharacterized protein n=1 Tax=Anisodus tanguticus TaxID=243964 RepID=A0AAE1RVJ3_9SOLA|nr:hypothetical protein RND71_023438 [Anisodus tanguticus]
MDPIVICNFVEVHGRGDILTKSPPKMIKFGDFDPIDVIKPLHHLMMNEERQSRDYHTDDEGLTLVSRQRRCKTSSRRKSSKQMTRENMMKRPKKPRETQYRKPRCPVTLEEFLPSWFRSKISHYDTKASCYNIDVEEMKKQDPAFSSPLLPEKLLETLSEEVDVCDA